MAKVTQFDKQNLSTIRAGVNAALKAYGDSIGVKFEIGNIGFTAGDFHTKLTAKIEGAESREDKELKSWMEIYNLQANGTGGRTLVVPFTRKEQVHLVHLYESWRSRSFHMRL